MAGIGDDETASLSRGRIQPHDPSFAPQGQADRAVLARQNLAEYLVGAYGVPDALVANRVETLSMQERVLLEIEMSEREKRLHSFDYDPLAVP